jgi:HD-GYP domain-containing protein (c-di-GMP phosphodiesterase class II)
MDARDRTYSIVLGAGFVVATVVAGLAIDSHRPLRMGVAVLLVLTYALAAQVEFEIGPGSAVPTELAFVPMLLLLPLEVVPAFVATSLLLADTPHYLRGQAHPARAIGALRNSWYCLGPVVVLAAFDAERPGWDHWPVYLLALAVQFAVDFIVSVGRGWFAFGVRPALQLAEMLSIWTVDLALAPLALAVVIGGAAVGQTYSFLGLVPLILLLALFARERRERIELGRAYRGTAYLLGDLIEADDEGTGLHSRDVVSLVLAVADRLGLDDVSRRDAEFAALLHDVGKIRLPKELINKPGPLGGAEWVLVKQHTILGEEMLHGVGGILGSVGAIVRSCHERYDGGGYPDGLAGDAIPVIARIILACDAYSAMTTDRSYRAARSSEEAIAELLVNRGTQFDPAVVDALVAVVGER